MLHTQAPPRTSAHTPVIQNKHRPIIDCELQIGCLLRNLTANGTTFPASSVATAMPEANLGSTKYDTRSIASFLSPYDPLRLHSSLTHSPSLIGAHPRVHCDLLDWEQPGDVSSLPSSRGVDVVETRAEEMKLEW